MDQEQPTLKIVQGSGINEALERALFEIKRVIAGQDAMLERVLVCLLAGGHLLIEGVPGLAKTLTIKTTANVLGGSFSRVQFTPDLVPADLVGTRIYQPGEGKFDVELGPVFCNFLLADEINRAPAKVQSALLEVMQEHQVTIGGEAFVVPEPFLVMATQNPIESEGTYPLPEAQVDRFMLKVLVDYPALGEELTVVERALAEPVDVRKVLDLDELVDAPAGDARGLRRPGRGALRRPPGDRHEEPGRDRPRGPAPVRGLRRQPARADQPRARRPRARRAPRPRLRATAGRPRAREGRAPPPARAHVPGARRGGLAGHAHRLGARGGGAASNRPVARRDARELAARSRPERTPGAARPRADARRAAPRARPHRPPPDRGAAARASTARPPSATARSWPRCGRTCRATTCARSSGT